jgi:acid phosphatase
MRLQPPGLPRRLPRLLPLAALTAMLSACGGGNSDGAPATGINQIETIVVIYPENRGFDNLYGLFPGANGVPGVNASSDNLYAPQKDYDGSVLAVLPPTWGGVTAAGQTVTVPQASTAGWANRPFQIDDPKGLQDTGVVVGRDVITRDLWHRFYQNQMQINGGDNAMFTAFADAGGLVMGYYDGSQMAMWKLARQYVLADNFFMGAFGGSFLNHQYLICACAPEYPNADASPAKGSISVVDADGFSLTAKADAAASVLEGSGPAARFVLDGNLTPKQADGKWYAVNTMQPPYQPSANAPAGNDAAKLHADPSIANTLPPQTAQHIGDLLDAKGIGWAWYAGAWNETLAAAIGNRDFNAGSPSAPAALAPDFQFHHQPFNYYAEFDPTAHAAARAAHLKDYSDLLADATAGKLPPVTFYKPQGNLNQHPGYANVTDGDDHVAGLIAKLQASPQWQHMVIVVTYDENGGFYDHAKVPQADQWGPGTRIPAIIVSPLAKQGYVDHTQYDTASALRLITRRFNLPQLPGLKQRDDALKANGFPAMGDLTHALNL